MSNPSFSGSAPASSGEQHKGQRGQLLVIFALSLVALIGMVGLIIDGGDSFLQRRDEQNVADAAAMAAGYASVNGQDPTAAAKAVATANGYTDDVGGTSVDVTIGATDIQVNVSRPHQNYFAGIMGFTSWGVSATASVQAGTPNAVIGAMPLIFNQKVFAKATNKDSAHPAAFSEPGTGTADVPTTDSTFNWTTYCTANGNPCNGNSAGIDALINNRGSSTTVTTNMVIGPLNAGSHTTLFNDLAAQVPGSYPVAIVDDTGAMVGWAYLHLTGSVGGSTKQINGWLDPHVNAPPMFIVQGGGPAGLYGSYSVKLTN